MPLGESRAMVTPPQLQAALMGVAVYRRDLHATPPYQHPVMLLGFSQVMPASTIRLSKAVSPAEALTWVSPRQLEPGRAGTSKLVTPRYPTNAFVESAVPFCF